MTVKQFVERAIEGGWRPFLKKHVYEIHANYLEYNGGDSEIGKWEILLDPLAWQAVGKVEGWRSLNDPDWQTNGWENVVPEWLVYMHRMIDSLADGKSVEQYLESL